MNLRRLHRITAYALALFILVHLLNHLTLLISPAAHLRVMETLRPFYRPLIIEIPLLAAFALQIMLGLRMALRRPWPGQRRAMIQRVSGLILGLFLIQHIAAALATRLTQDNIDTNIYWAASVVSTTPHVWYFAPYYGLGCLSLFVHFATHLHRHTPRLAFMLTGTGAIFASVIVISLIGAQDLPAPYIAYRDGLLNWR